ncbi:14024_t:CDS:1, partial [Gigaspora rosea]
MDVAMDIITTMRDQNDQTKQHWLLFIDQQKAFDRVNHRFMEMVLKKMNFDIKFTNIIKGLFAGQTAHIADAGQLSESFRISKG